MMRFTKVIFVCAMCLSTTAFAFQDVSKEYTDFKSTYAATRLHLVFSQPSYAPGDTIWFSAWYLNEASKPLTGSQTAFVELVAANGQSKQMMNFKVDNGRASNQLVIPVDFPVGNYRIYAYTNWMKNFGTDWFFKKNIVIQDRSATVGKPIIDVSVRPEGGNFVAGIENTIALVSPGSSKVNIVDESDHVAAEIVIDSTGVGKGTMTPVKGNAYYAQRADGSKTLLSAVSEDGVAIHFDHRARKFTVHASPSMQGKELTAVVTGNGKIEELRKFTPAADAFEFPLTNNNAPGLFQQFYILDRTGRVLAERVFAKADPLIVSSSVDVPAEAAQRQRIELAVPVGSKAELSVSAYRKDLFNSTPMRLGFYISELSDAYQWAESTQGHEQSLNDFLITQTWSRTDWSRIMAEDKKMTYPFSSIVLLKGSVVSRDGGKPVADSTNVIAYLQKNTMGYDANTRDGRFVLPFVFDFYQDDHVFFYLRNRFRDLDADYKVVLDNDSVKWKSIRFTPASAIPSPYGQYMFSKRLITNSYSFFTNDNKAVVSTTGPNAAYEDEIGAVDYTANVQEYVVFPTMEDLLREVIPFVQYRKTGPSKTQGVHMMYRIGTSTKLFKSSPLYIVDGTLTKNSNFFMSLKPKDLMKVKVVNNLNRLQQMGKIADNGIVFIESRKGDMGDSLKRANDFPVIGLSRPSKYASVDYSVKQLSQRIPDLRAVNAWQPYLPTDATGKANYSFYTSDDLAPLTVLVQGITADGVPVYIRKEIVTKFRQSN